MLNALAAWTCGSIALFVIAARLSSTRIGSRVRASSVGRMATEGARFIFYVGLPYAALLTGAFVPRDVGLQGSPAPDLILEWTPEAWARAFGQAAALGGLTLAAIALLAWQVRRARGYGPLALGIDSAPIAFSIREAIYAEAHWSFYRALPMLLLADAHWTGLAGLALVTVEALLAGRRARTDTARIRLFDALLAGLSATYFTLTGGNVWVAIALQIGVRVVTTGLVYASHGAESPSEPIVKAAVGSAAADPTNEIIV